MFLCIDHMQGTVWTISSNRLGRLVLFLPSFYPQGHRPREFNLPNVLQLESARPRF